MDAFSQWPHKRIQEEIHELTGDYYTFNRYWPDREFTCGYVFEQVHFGQGTVSFEQAINNMGENQFLLICVMGGYRVNRFYNSFMHRHLSYMKYFSDYIYDLHIITSEPDQENHPDYFVHEKEVIDTLGPIKLLNDPEWDICECLEPHGSPTIYAVNKSRNVMYEGELFDCDIWDLINEVE